MVVDVAVTVGRLPVAVGVAVDVGGAAGVAVALRLMW